MPFFIREKVYGGLNLGGTLGTSLAAAWEADKKRFEIDDLIPERRLRKQYPDSQFIKKLDTFPKNNTKRINAIRSIKEIRLMLTEKDCLARPGASCSGS